MTDNEVHTYVAALARVIDLDHTLDRVRECVLANVVHHHISQQAADELTALLGEGK